MAKILEPTGKMEAAYEMLINSYPVAPKVDLMNTETIFDDCTTDTYKFNH